MKIARTVVRDFIGTSLEGSDARRQAARDAFDAIEAELEDRDFNLAEAEDE